MERNKPKKLCYICLILLAGLVLSLSAMLWFSHKGAWNGALHCPKASFSVWEGESLVLSPERAKAISQGTHSLQVKNEERESLCFALYANGTLLKKKQFAPKEKQLWDLSLPEKSCLSLVIIGKKTAIAYLTDTPSANAVIQALPKGGDLVFLKDTEWQSLRLTAPFRLFGAFSFEELQWETEEKGRFVLYPEAKQKVTIFVNAPRASVYTKNLSFTFPKSERDYYIKAKRLNDVTLNPDYYPVTSYENLARLADDTKLPRLKDGAEFVFLSSFTVEDSLSFSVHATLDFKKSLSFGNHSLHFSSDKEGEYRVKIPFGSGISAENLVFTAPLSTLIWEGEGNIPRLSSIEKQNNIYRYNGTKLRLGGKGIAVPRLSLLKKDNDFIDEDITFTVKGNTLSAILPYSVSREVLKEAVFTLSCEKGTAVWEESPADGVIVTRDEAGEERRFLLAVERAPYEIPVVYIETENGSAITSKSQYVNATFSMKDKNGKNEVKEIPMRIRGRGNSTWKWDKKPYKIHFNEPTSLFGLAKGEEWALISNYADKSLMRNHLAQAMAEELSFSYCPSHEYVDVFLNGEYQGVYTLGEHLEEGEGRVEVNHNMAGLDCGYFLEVGGVVAGVDVKGMNYFHAGLLNFVLIKTPDYNALTGEQFDYIQNYLTKADAAVKAGEGYENYIDVESLVDWLIMTELSYNTDCAWRRSTYMTKSSGGKLVMGPVWDFDLAFGNFSKDNAGFSTWVSTEPDDDYIGETWSTYLLEDEEFQAAFRARWEEVSASLMERAMMEIENSAAQLRPSAQENFTRWDILGKKVAFERHDTKDYPTYESQIQYLKNFLINRAAWIDAQVATW